MKERLEKNLVIDALLTAQGHRKPVVDVLHRSDRDSQYTSKEYQALLKQAGISCSMSGKANCGTTRW
jgi:transposase InsO family protein